MKKKLLAILLMGACAIACAIGLTACDGSDGDHNHKYEVEVVPPTCSEQGYTLHSCECGDSFKDNYVGKSQHTPVTDPEVKATCTTAGKTEGSHCSVCKTVIVAQEDIPASHTVVKDPAVDSTCTTKGKSEGKHCSVCNTVIVAQTELDLLDHDLHDNKCYNCDYDAGGSKNLSYESVFVTNIDGNREWYWDVRGIGSCTDTEIVIPAMRDGLPVKSIKYFAFGNCTSITSVTIPDGVTFIGSDAFTNCTALESVRLPEGVSQIDYNMFKNCSSLVSITIPASVTEIGNEVFKGCTTLKNVTVKGDVTLGYKVFDGCSAIENLIFEGKLIRLNDNSFVGCNIKNLSILTDCYTAGSSVVGNTYTVENAMVPASFTFFLPKGASMKTLKVICGDEIKYRLTGCSELTSVTIADSVKLIDRDVFKDCTKLKYNSYGNAKYLGNDDNPYHALIKGDSTSINGCEINQNAKVIAAGAFEECYYLTEMTIPESVTSIESYTFYHNIRLITVKLHDKVTDIGDYAFGKCTSLVNIEIPASVTSIGENAFEACSLATDVDNGVTYLGKWAVSSDLNVTAVQLRSNTVGIADHTFSNRGSLTSIVIPNGVTGIGYAAFANCTALNSVTMGSGIKSIGTSAFYGCTALETITIPEGITVLEGSTFCGCTALETITIPDGVTSIGSEAFNGCTSLTSIIIPDSVTLIDSNAFYNCTSLTSVTIPDGVTSIGMWTFYNCTSLTSVTIPDSVTSIGQYAFRDCTSLTSITIPDSVTKIGWPAFDGCPIETAVIPTIAISCIKNSALKTVEITSGESIGDHAFSDCTSLTSITICSGVTGIGYAAFANCTDLTSVTYNGTIEQWNAIVKFVGWNNDTGDYTIICTDGKLDKSGNVITE